MIQVIDRTFDILELLGSSADSARSLSEISEKTGLKKTTCANIMRTLLERGYVEQSGGKRDYRLGFKAYKLVGAPKFHERMAAVTHEALQMLYDSTGETVVLAGIEGNRRIVISVIELSDGITARINHSYNIYRAATGRVILACYPPGKREVTIERIGLPDIADWPEVRTREQLDCALADIRESGMSETFGFGGIVGIAVPLFKNGTVIASVGVCLPAFRWCGDKVSHIRSSFKTAASSMEKSLYYGIM